ncbi:DUF4376 domain-containing protein [Bosea sp. WAO]|uniref:DUF4376 domain-containing protein n=1 Tax=Bosea sp. WAO TaxID=406341 RepID=UPI00082EF1B3|nr:DUF4376 domain-containing protein [Bosea sp. WAO]
MTTQKALGQSFAREIEAAGLMGLPWSYEPNGTITGRENLSPEQDSVLQATIDAHDPVRSGLIDYARERRWQVEVGGIVVGGVPIATDQESQGKILGAYVAASRNPDWTTLWDSVHPLDAATMLAIGDAVQSHINASFTVRGDVLAAIAAGTITTREEIDAAFA